MKRSCCSLCFFAERRVVVRAGWRLLCLPALLVLVAHLAGAAELDFAPFFSRDTDVFGSARTRVLGPLFEARRAPGGENFSALRPLYSDLDLAPARQHELDVLWPVWRSSQINQEHDWRFMVLMNGLDYNTDDPDSAYRFVIFPVYFQGRDKHKRPYCALFPLGGVIRDYLWQDEMCFILFPLYSYSRINEAETRSWLWPVFSATHGGGHERWRVFPIYGFTRFRADYEKIFLLWPVWTAASYNYPRSSGKGFVLFPLFGRTKLTNQETWMFVPPLIRFSKGAKQREVYCPWPIFQWSAGQIDKLYFWPLWGYKSMEGNQSSFVLWPLYRSARRFNPQEEHDRVMLMPIMYYTHKRKALPESPGTWATAERSLKIWPLFSSHQKGDSYVLRMVSLFPFMDYEPVERNYSALWTIYSHSACGAVKEDELLWGLFRWRRAGSGAMRASLFPLFAFERRAEPGDWSWSFLKGLVGYKRAGQNKTFQLLYLLEF